MLDGFDAQIIGFVAPTLIQEFKIQPAALATTFQQASSGSSLGCLLLAPFADWLGRRWLIIFSIFLVGAATLLTSRVETCTSSKSCGLSRDWSGRMHANALALTAEYARLGCAEP